MTYYCEDRLHLIACEKCGTLALTKAVSPQVAANLTLRQPTLAPPNNPLTLEQLRKMDGEPVWVDTIKRWGIVRVCGYGISVLTKSGEYDVTRMKFYRRPPEGEVDA